MLIHNTEHTFCYIDPSYSKRSTTPGDGSTPLSPLVNFPTAENWADDTIYLVRRCADKSMASIAKNTLVENAHSLVIWGMPEKNAEHWEDVPEVARSAWEDAEQYTYEQAGTIIFRTGHQYFTRTGTGTADDPYTYAMVTLISQEHIQPSSYFLKNGNEYVQCEDLEFSEEKTYYTQSGEEYIVAPILGTKLPSGTFFERYAAKAWIKFENITRSENDYRLYLNHCYNCAIENVVFYDYIEDGYSRGDYDKYCVHVDSSYGTNVYLNNIWFRPKTDYTRGEGWDYWGCGCGYIHAGSSAWGHSFVMKNCRIDVESHFQHSIYCGYKQYIEIKDCTINYCSDRDRYNRAIIQWSDSYDKGPIIDIDGIDATYFARSYENDCRRMPTMMSGNILRGSTKNITFKVSEDQWTTQAYDILWLRPIMSHRLLSPGFTLSNVTYNMPWLSGDRSQVIYLEYCNQYKWNSVDGMYPSFGQYIKITDIDITMRTADSTKVYSSESSHGENIFENYSSNESPACLYLTRVDRYDRVPSSDFHLKTISIKAPYGVAMRVEHALLDMKTDNLEGGVYLLSTLGKINKISSWYPGYFVNDGGANTLYIAELAGNKSNPSYEYVSQYAVHASWRSNMLINKSNVRCFTEDVNRSANDSQFFNCSYICTNNIDTGNYTSRNKESLCRTWSVQRIGSVSGCSLKLYNTSGDCDWSRPLMIGGEPFKGITKSVTAGKHVATIYMTTFGYNNPEQIMQRFNVKIKSSEGKLFFSEKGNWSEEDQSTWDDIENHTPYKLEIPFELAEAGTVEFEYQWNWPFSGDAATFVDPHPVIS